MRYLLEGDFAEIGKILKENRIRAERGLVKFTALPDEGDSKDAAIFDSKEPKVEPDDKTVKKPKGKK